MAFDEFQEFGLIDKDGARTVIETYSSTSGQGKARCLPSEFHHIKHARCTAEVLCYCVNTIPVGVLPAKQDSGRVCPILPDHRGKACPLL